MKENILIKTVNTNGIYSCEGLDITVEEWKKVLQDSAISNKQKLWLARFYQEPEHKASCKFMGKKFSCDKNSPNATIKNFGQSTQKILNRFEVQGTDGEKTYWVIPMKQGRYVNGNFEWTMRDELVQAMEELDMTDPEKFEKKKFSWISFYMELAEKLLEYKDNRNDLVKIVYEMDRQYVNYIKDDKGNDYPDIDPFSVFAIFNRTSTEERRKEICKYFKRVFQLQSDIPEDFDSIPMMNPQLSVFVWRGDIFTGIQPIWDLYISVVKNHFDNEKFVEQFDIVRNQKGIKWNLTMALYWIRPYNFMPLDTPSREYLKRIGIEVFEEKNLNGENYLQFLQKIKSKMENNEIIEKSFPEISYNAWIKDTSSQGETQMENLQAKLISETKNLLENTKNLILTGAPGTGKTYLAKQIAEKMGCEKENIGFVQFHQSYDYTDFVEGLRPVQNDGNNQIGFERKDGVFKEFCGKALKNLVDSRKTKEEVTEENNRIKAINEFLSTSTGKENLIYSEYVQKEFYIDDIENDKIKVYYSDGILVGDIGLNDLEIVLRNKEKIGNQTRIIEAVGDILNRWKYHKMNSYIWILCKEIEKLITDKTEITEIIPQKPFVFIIDEINRGEVSKIFGELFYSVDPGYRVSADDLEKTKSGEKTITSIRTQYANMETDGNDFDRALNSKDFGHFFIPENVYIIGTMNDIDRSVESMDFAFRRRFAWKEITADDTQYMLDEVEKDGVIYGLSSEIAEESKERMDRLNDEISKVPELNSAYHIGASYFLKLKNYEGESDNGFQSLWNYHLKGILEEYLRGNPEKADLMKKLKAAYDGEDVTNEG